MEGSDNIYTTSQVPNTQVAKKSPMEMIQLGLLGIAAKIKSILPAKETNQFPSSMLKKVLEVGVIILVILALLVIATYSLRIVKNQITPSVIATPVPTLGPSVATPAPGKYSTDPSVLKLNSDTNNLDGELSRIDIGESNIKPRPFNWDIKFK